jgi:hypothetical protein
MEELKYQLKLFEYKNFDTEYTYNYRIKVLYNKFVNDFREEYPHIEFIFVRNYAMFDSPEDMLMFKLLWKNGRAGV